jgi:hypothetical protein
VFARRVTLDFKAFDVKAGNWRGDGALASFDCGEERIGVGALTKVRPAEHPVERRKLPSDDPTRDGTSGWSCTGAKESACVDSAFMLV